MSRGYANRPEDIWQRVARGSNADCWPFLGGCNLKGYGQMRLGGRQLQAHRIAFHLGTGVDPVGLLVCHRCDNPPCCNPAHLFLGSYLDNNRDCASKGRKPVAERHPMAKLAIRQVGDIRERRAQGERGVDLAAEFGVTPQLISLIHHNRIWVTA